MTICEKETENMLTKIQEEKILREAMQKQRKEAEENEKKRKEADVVNNSMLSIGFFHASCSLLENAPKVSLDDLLNEFGDDDKDDDDDMSMTYTPGDDY
jgi:hypothetical protein